MNTDCERNILTLVGLVFSVLAVWVFLNLVTKSTAWSAPHEDAPTQVQQNAEGPALDRVDSIKPPDQNVLENISVTPPPPSNARNSVRDWASRFDKGNYYYPYRKEIEAHFGIVLGITDSSDDEDLMNYVVGFNYLLPKQLSPRWSVGADLSTVGNGHLHVARRFIYNEKGAFRPFYEYGGMHKIVPDERMSSFSNSDNYLLWGAVGFNDIRRPPKSVTCQLQAAIGLEDFLVMMTLGYSWGF